MEGGHEGNGSNTAELGAEEADPQQQHVSQEKADSGWQARLGEKPSVPFPLSSPSRECAVFINLSDYRTLISCSGSQGWCSSLHNLATFDQEQWWDKWEWLWMAVAGVGE